MSLPTPPLHGGCQCGACRYEISAAPLFGYVCHCLECRRHTTSAFSASILVRTDALKAEGPISVWVRDNANGPPLEAHFCAACGVRLFHHSVPAGALVRVKVGTLDDADWFKPAAEYFTKRRYAWVLPFGEAVLQCVEADAAGADPMGVWRRLTT